MIRYYWICIFLCACLWTEAQEDKANDLMEADRFSEAAVALERAIFESDDLQQKNRLLLRKAQCYKSLGDYESGIRNLKRIRFTNSDSLKRAVAYETLLLHYLNGEYQEAYSRVVRIQSQQAETPETLVLSFLVHVDLERWEEARNLLADREDVFAFSESDIAFILPAKWKPKSPDKANSLSLLPGIGQWYAGYFWKGVLSGGIQTLLGVFSIYSLVEGYILTGTLTGVSLFYTFYLGGARHAGELAVRKNQERANAIKSRFFEKLEATDSARKY